MSEESIEEIAERVGPDRRAFVRRLVVGTAFAVPVVSSINMTGLSMGVAGAGANQTSP